MWCFKLKKTVNERGYQLFPVPASFGSLGTSGSRLEGPGPEKGEPGEPVTTEAFFSNSPDTLLTPHSPCTPVFPHFSPHSYTHKPPHRPHCPPSPTAKPDSLQPPTQPLTYTCSPHPGPCLSLIRLPPLCTSPLPETFHAGLPHTLFSLCAHPHPPPPHFISHTSACLPAPLALHALQSHTTPFPQGPWLPTPVCTHCFTQIPH